VAAGAALAAVVGLAGCGSSGSTGLVGAIRPAGDAGDAHALAVTAPAGAAFYRPASPLPAGRPGDVLRYRRVDPPGSPRRFGVTTIQVMYLSTDALGRRTAVTGTVLFPKGINRAAAPVVGFASGTHGLGDSCAPSRDIVAGTDYEQSDIAAALARGWVVAATDYEGVGTPGDATYIVGRAEGPAVIDSVRAALRLPGSGLSATARVAYVGYSQGGGAAAWAGELSAQYAPDLRLVGVAAGGVPADPAALRASLDGTVWSGLALGAALGFSAAYPELNLNRYLTPAGRTGLAGLRQACVGAMLGPPYQYVRLSDYLSPDPVNDPAWRARFAQNTLGSRPPRVPVLLYHGQADTTVAYGQAEALARTYCAHGADVTWLSYPGQDHGGAAAAGQAAVLAFLTARFADEPTSRRCPS
jgi:Secretory lipase